MKYFTVIIVSVLLLLAALFKFPYGFYTFLRFAVCSFSVYCSINLVMVYGKKTQYYVLPILVAILYNPIIRVHLDRGTWKVINLVTIGLIWVPFLFREFRDSIEG